MVEYQVSFLFNWLHINSWDTFLPDKWIKNLCLSLEVFLMVEKGPFGVSNNRCTSAVFGLEILMSLGPTH